MKVADQIRLLTRLLEQSDCPSFEIKYIKDTEYRHIKITIAWKNGGEGEIGICASNQTWTNPNGFPGWMPKRLMEIINQRLCPVSFRTENI